MLQWRGDASHASEDDGMKRWRHLLPALGIWILLIPAHGECVKRILIVGDSWAASIAADAVDTPGFGSFDAVLDANGLGAYGTQGARTAWGGRKACDWVKAQNLQRITDELSRYATIDCAAAKSA